MATISRFEDLRVWKLAREIVNDVYDITSQGDIAKDFSLRDQIRRSALSIMSNIAEGFESGSDKKFAYYIRIAKSSAGECRSQLYVLLDQDHISQDNFDLLNDKLTSVSSQLSSFEAYLNKNKHERAEDIVIEYG